jgi:hypothetical protein
MAIASGIYAREVRRLKKSGEDVDALFKRLPSE